MLPHHHNTSWTAHELERLKARVSSGSTREQIAASFGRTREATKKKLVRLRLGGKPPPLGPAWSELEDRQLTLLKLSGFKYREIGAKLGRTADACGVRWRKLQKGEE